MGCERRENQTEEISNERNERKGKQAPHGGSGGNTYKLYFCLHSRGGALLMYVEQPVFGAKKNIGTGKEGI